MHTGMHTVQVVQVLVPMVKSSKKTNYSAALLYCLIRHMFWYYKQILVIVPINPSIKLVTNSIRKPISSSVDGISSQIYFK